MELLVVLGTAIFLILLGALMYLIFGGGNIGAVALMVCAVIMVSATGLATFMGIQSILPRGLLIDSGMVDAPLSRMAVALPSMNQIANITICSDGISPTPCSGPDIQPTNNVIVYWQVLDGVGCCATYNCSYTAFERACIKPFMLYDISLDEVYIDWAVYNFSDYNYTCVADIVPWNWITFYNVSLGRHTIVVEQKDCYSVVSTAMITFSMILLDGIYYVEVD